MINNPNPASGVSQPRGLVTCNGERVAGLISFSVDNNSFFQADSFRLTLALSGQPSNRGFDWWAQQEKMEFEFFIGFPDDPDSFSKDDLTSFLVGYGDDLDFDPVADTITIVGRDLTSKLIDYRNALFAKASGALVSSDIVTQIAAAQGLTPVVTKTSQAVGSYYQIVNSLITGNSTYWDIVTRLAQLEGFQAYVKGHELHFEPRATSDSNPYVIRWQAPNDMHGYPIANAIDIRLSRNLSIAKDLRVRVLSFDPKSKQPINEYADRTRVKSKNSAGVKYDGPPQEYVYKIDGLNAVKAKAIAQQKLAQLSQHEMNLNATLPGDLLLTAQNIVRLEGTNTTFDQSYFVASIMRTYSMDEGFRMQLQAKNQTPNSPT